LLGKENWKDFKQLSSPRKVVVADIKSYDVR